MLEQYDGDVLGVVIYSLAVDPGLNAIFDECRVRNNGEDGKNRVGSPVSNYHYWGSLTVRDYDGGSFGWCLMSYLYPNAGVRKCYLVRTAFWGKWRSLGGPYSFLGMPITDEYPSFRYGLRARQDFADGGYMVWYDTYVQIYNWKGERVNAASLLVEQPTPKAETAITSVSPNPFNPNTRISFTLPESGNIILSVYDVSGRKVRTLAAGPFPAGEHTVLWEGKNKEGGKVSSGIYFVRLATQSAVCTRKLVLLK